MAAKKPRTLTPEERAILDARWKAGDPQRSIADRLGMSVATLVRIAERMGLPPRGDGAKETYRDSRKRASADICRRRAIVQPDPVRFAPAASTLGAPTKTLDDHTRALIDAALARRAS